VHRIKSLLSGHFKTPQPDIESIRGRTRRSNGGVIPHHLAFTDPVLCGKRADEFERRIRRNRVGICRGRSMIALFGASSIGALGEQMFIALSMASQ
jgi:hypothetical protein